MVIVFVGSYRNIYTHYDLNHFDSVIAILSTLQYTILMIEYYTYSFRTDAHRELNHTHSDMDVYIQRRERRFTKV